MFDSLSARLRALNLSVEIRWNTPTPARHGPEWFIGKSFKIGEKEIFRAWFGDYSRDLKEEWASDRGVLYSESDAKEVAGHIASALKEAREARGKEWEAVALQAGIDFYTYANRGTTPYLERKKIPDLLGCHILTHPSGSLVLIVPLRDTQGKIWNYQRIFPERLSAGDKFMLPGGKIDGLFHAITPVDKDRPVYIAEGFSTAASIHLALKDQVVVCAVNAGNLYKVGKALRDVYPDLQLVFCADNDRGREKNVGVVKAKEAAERLHAEVRVAHLEGGEPVDFNDVHTVSGLDAVRAQILSPPPALESPAPVLPSKPSELQIVKALLTEFGENLIAQDDDLFIYRDTHWHHLHPKAAARFLRPLLGRAAPGLKQKELVSLYGRLLDHIPRVPEGVNFFTPNPFVQNFRNGALTLTARADGTFDLGTRGHARGDFLLHCHPFDYRDDAAPNLPFEEACLRVLGGHQEVEAYAQVLGACLVAAFPKIVFFVGKPGSGKSTLIKFAAQLVHPSLRCSVDPTQWHGFNMETMAGKLLNFDTDIALTKPLSDAQLKKVIDRIPMRIQRKGIADLMGTIPPLHLFGANEMPQSHDRSGAYDRRSLIFKCASYQAPSDYVHDFDVHLWRENSQGVVSFAVKGLQALCQAKGHFLVPASSLAAREEWKTDRADVVEQFVMELQEGSVNLDPPTRELLLEKGRIERKMIWKMFKLWIDEFTPAGRNTGQHELYRRLKQLGFEVVPYSGVRYFGGFRCQSGTGEGPGRGEGQE